MDFVRIDYTASIKDGKTFDSTDADTARKENIFDDKRVYKPLPIVVGEGHVVKGLDEILGQMKVGLEKTIEVSPDKAFGERDVSQIRLVPLKVFKQQGINPIPGMPVELDGRMARIQTVAGGRVRVDFNHDLAGKIIVYKIKMVSKSTSDKDKINLLVERSFNEAEDFKINLTGKKLNLELPEKVCRDKNILYRKASLSAELFKYLSLSEVTYSETWKNPKVEKKEKKE